MKLDVEGYEPQARDVARYRKRYGDVARYREVCAS